MARQDVAFRLPRVAFIATTYIHNSHADVLGRRVFDGYAWEGRHTKPRVKVVSAYLEQLGSHTYETGPRPDIGVEVLDRHGVPRYPTVAEAVGCGGPGVNVDGVIIIGEHGDYELNEYGQKLYPRRRLFDAAVSTMIGAGRTVPIFTDKHLAWAFADARVMYNTARRLEIPLLAGSSIPLARRIPAGTQWPFGEPMTDVVLVGYGPTEIYGFHNIEALQVHAERRAGGESGVVGVQGLAGEAAARALKDGTVDAELFDRALATFDLDESAAALARQHPAEVFVIEYADGLRGAVVNCRGALKGFAVSARGPNGSMTCQMWEDEKLYDSQQTETLFTFLVRQIESLMVHEAEPYPVERTLLTTGILDAAILSLNDAGHRHETPELAIAYQPVEHIADTGMGLSAPPTAVEASAT